MKPDIKTWIIKTSDNREVKVDYKSHGLGEHRVCPHLEFHGYAISETGYRSHFFGGITEVKPDLKEVYQLAIKLVEEWRIPPQQIKLV